MKKDVMILVGAGQIGMTIVRRTGFGMKIFVGGKSLKNAKAICQVMNEAGGSGIQISSQSGFRMPALTPEQDEALVMTPTEGLLRPDFLQPDKIKDTLYASQVSRRANEKRVMYEAVRWVSAGHASTTSLRASS